MRTVTIEVAPPEINRARAMAAFAGEVQGEFICFPTYERLATVMNPKRVEIVQAMMGQGALSIREVARRVDRDVKAVHGDVQKLLQTGVLEKTDEGRVVCPYDEVRFNFGLKSTENAA